MSHSFCRRISNAKDCSNRQVKQTLNGELFSLASAFLHQLCSVLPHQAIEDRCREQLRKRLVGAPWRRVRKSEIADQYRLTEKILTWERPNVPGASAASNRLKIVFTYNALCSAEQVLFARTINSALISAILSLQLRSSIVAQPIIQKPARVFWKCAKLAARA